MYLTIRRLFVFSFFIFLPFLSEATSDMTNREKLNYFYEMLKSENPTKKEVSRAIDLLTEVAEEGAPEAWFQLGLLYSIGQHIPRNIQYSNYLHKTNYEEGYLKSGGALALNYLHEYYSVKALNNRNTQLLDNAIKLLEETSSLGEVPYIRELYKAYFIKGDIVNGEKWLEWSVEKDDLESIYLQAQYFEAKSELVSSYLEKALENYRRLKALGYKEEFADRKIVEIEALISN